MWCCMVVAITLTCDVWYNGVLASRLYCAGGGSVPGTVALPVLDTRYQYGRFSMKKLKYTRYTRYRSSTLSQPKK